MLIQEQNIGSMTGKVWRNNDKKWMLHADDVRIYDKAFHLSMWYIYKGEWYAT